MNKAQIASAIAHDLRQNVRAAALPWSERGIRDLARRLADQGWAKPEPKVDQESLKGVAFVIDEADPQADPFLVFGYDMGRNTVKLEQVGHHPEAALKRQVEKYGARASGPPRFDPIWLCRVLAVHGDASDLFGREI